MINWSYLGEFFFKSILIYIVLLSKKEIHDFVFIFLQYISYEEPKRDLTLNDDMF
jgi:hypothetical protein